MLVGQVCRYILQCSMRIIEVMLPCLLMHSTVSSVPLSTYPTMSNETNRGNVVLSVNAFYSIYWVIVLVGPVCRYILQYPMRLTEVMWSCLSIHSIESSESLCCRCILQWSLRLIEVMLSCLSIHSNVSLCWPLKSVDISFNVQWDQ